MKRLQFLVEGIKNIQNIGSVAPSGPAMCKMMSSFVDPNHHGTIIEMGAGDGVITRHILKKMPKDGVLLAFEINPTLYNTLLKIDDTRLIPICDDILNIEHYLTERNITKVDMVISAIPFLVLPDHFMESVLTLCKNILTSEGIFVQMHYSNHTQKKYKRFFKNVKSYFVPLNIPPGYVYLCSNKD